MKKEIALQEKKVEYTLRRSGQTRVMRLAVYCDGSVVVTAPVGWQEMFIERFLRDKAAWLLSKLELFERFGFRQYRTKRQEQREYLKHRDTARTLVGERLTYFNTAYGFAVGRISIRNQKTRWGSCSRRGNLSFNYRIALLPGRLRDYIVVHELCHLGEFSHSHEFWRLVERTMPDHREIRRELRNVKFL